MTPQQIEMALETIALVLEDLKKTQEKQQATITAIKETLAEHAMRETQRTEQEPVAWQFMNGSSFRKRRPDDFADLDSDGLPYWRPLYTSPPQRTWVGLTKNERLELYRQFEDFFESDDWEYEKAIETKLKEKNT